MGCAAQPGNTYSKRATGKSRIHPSREGRPKSEIPNAYQPFVFHVKNPGKASGHSFEGQGLAGESSNAHQYAYPWGKSTELALNNLVEKIEQFFAEKEIAGIFLDIEGAFNNALPMSLTAAARARATEPNICGWIEALLTQRVVISEMQGEVVRFWSARGCPQGGVLSLFLQCLLVDDLLATLLLWNVEV